MSKNLVIVESPAKAKTINKYLGSDYEVLASYGHVRDLVNKDGSVLPEDDFAMKWQLGERAGKTIKDIKSAVKKADALFLAPDPDREGEAIGWHLAKILKCDPEKTKRIIFTEITKTAIQKAVKNPTVIDINMFNAQQARRILDRIIGYLISPILWKQIQSSYQEKKSKIVQKIP